jgi:glycosyltransferase involved in cell wall biosynthesis
VPDLMRVAFTTLAPFISGAERSLQVTLRHLPAAGVEPLVVGPPGAAIAQWCQRNGIPFHGCPIAVRDKWHPIRWWRSVSGLRSIFRDQRVRLVHANQMWCYPAVGAAAGDLGLPRVCHLRDDAAPAGLRWWCTPTPELIIGISRHTARQAIAAWPPATGGPRIETVINPVELPAPVGAVTDRRIRDKARAVLGLPAGATIFGFIGQLREVKGVLGLLDAVAALSARRPWHLVIAGRDPNPGAPYEALCRDRAAGPDLAGRVSFLGFVDDTTEFYRAIDVAVVPSLAEPLGRVPLEAAAHGRPSVAFAVGGLPDTIRDGETGWLVPAEDWPGLSAALDRLLSGSSPEVGSAARDWVEQVADPAAYARRLAAMYHRTLGGAKTDAHTHAAAATADGALAL